jgi:hypothetical protein
MDTPSESERLCFWVIYARPSDYPDHYVIRRQYVNQDGSISYNMNSHLFPDLQSARQFIPTGRIRFNRSPDDDPVIVESWL